MEIKIGELFIGGESDFKLSPQVSGLESPAFRVGDGLYAGRDGGHISGVFYGHRTIIIKGFYIGANCEEAARLRKVLLSYLRIRHNLPVVITTAYGEYYTEGFVTDIKAEIENLVAGEFQLTLVCPDPILYESVNGEPKWYNEILENGNTTTVSNEGDVEIYPIITITGRVYAGIELTNTTTQQTMQINISTSEDSDEIIVDMGKRLITLNGEGINEDRSLNSVWWYLAQEDNGVLVNAEEESGEELNIEIKYRKGYAGL